MYKIIGADQKEYGPVTEEQVKRWIAEGRANATTLVKPDGVDEWKPLSTLAEFADALGAQPGPAPTLPPVGAPGGLAEDVLSRDYSLDIGGCVGRAWELVKANFGILFGGVAVFLLVQGALSLVAQIPFVGILVSLASIIITGPMTGGVYWLTLKVVRGQPAEISDVFAGFKAQFGNLILGYIVVAILMGLSTLPGLAIMAYPIFSMIHHHAAEPVMVALAAMGAVVLLVPVIYLSVSWMFTLALIIDRQMPFWPAMGASRRMVGKHWWAMVGLVVVCGLINLAGFLVCCVGVFVSMPITFSAMMYAYETVFSGPAAQNR